MTARFGSALAQPRRRPRGRGRGRRSRPPAPAIPPPSPGSRPERSIRSGRWPRPIAATMPATMPNPPNFSPRSSQREGGALNQAEALVNEALQKSNLGRYAEADSLFSRADGDGRRRSGDRAAAAQLSRHAPAQPGHGRRGASRARPADAADRRSPPGFATSSSTGRSPAGSAPNRRARAGCAGRRG